MSGSQILQGKHAVVFGAGGTIGASQPSTRSQCSAFSKAASLLSNE